MKIKTLKLTSLAITLALSITSLTACSSGSATSGPFTQSATFDDKGEPSKPGQYGYGVSGSVLPALNEDGDNLESDDRIMADVCQYDDAFETGKLRMGGESPTKLDRAELITDFRMSVIGGLADGAGDYPEFGIYLQGAKEKLADPTQNTDYYKMLLKACEPYKALLTRTINNWVDSTAVGPGSCWYSGDPKNLVAYLQKKVDGDWVTIETVVGFKKGISECSDKKYPYGYETTHTFWHSTEIRWLVKALDGTTFDNGHKEDISDTQTVGPGQSSVW